MTGSAGVLSFGLRAIIRSIELHLVGVRAANPRVEEPPAADGTLQM